MKQPHNVTKSMHIYIIKDCIHPRFSSLELYCVLKFALFSKFSVRRGKRVNFNKKLHILQSCLRLFLFLEFFWNWVDTFSASLGLNHDWDSHREKNASDTLNSKIRKSQFYFFSNEISWNGCAASHVMCFLCPIKKFSPFGSKKLKKSKV